VAHCVRTRASAHTLQPLRLHAVPQGTRTHPSQGPQCASVWERGRDVFVVWFTPAPPGCRAPCPHGSRLRASLHPHGVKVGRITAPGAQHACGRLPRSAGRRAVISDKYDCSAAVGRAARSSRCNPCGRTAGVRGAFTWGGWACADGGNPRAAPRLVPTGVPLYLDSNNTSASPHAAHPVFVSLLQARNHGRRAGCRRRDQQHHNQR